MRCPGLRGGSQIAATALALAWALAPGAASAQDMDGDGVPDALDNCLLVPNAPPFDCNTDGDAFGNACDGDFNNDSFVTLLDFAPPLFMADFLAGVDSGIGSDMDCNGVVNANDSSVFLGPQLAQGFPGP